MVFRQSLCNIDEKPDEDLKDELTKFMKNDMQISPSDIFYYLGGEIRLDIVHRLGISSNSKNPHPIVATLVTRDGKDAVLAATGNLKGKRVGVSEQLPPAMKERRSAVTEAAQNLKRRR